MSSLFDDLFKVVGEVKSIGDEVKQTLEEAANEGAQAVGELKNEAGNAIDGAKHLAGRDKLPKPPAEQD